MTSIAKSIFDARSHKYIVELVQQRQQFACFSNKLIDLAQKF
jgi:hypothetical protein